MTSNKLQWTKPQLIVLARGTSDESVLTHCKYIGNSGDFPNGAQQNGCNEGPITNCGTCQSRSGS